MGDLTKNLSRHEFACKCSANCYAKHVVDFELVQAIQGAVDYFGSQPGTTSCMVVITSGNRCVAHNKATPGAASNSYHTKCLAADHRIVVTRNGRAGLLPPLDLYNYYDAKYPTKYGIKLYSNRVHLDVRKTKWRDSK